MGQGKKDLSAAYIEQAVEASLKRLQVDAIDLYLSHWPDPTTPYEETLGAYQKLIARGKIRHVGASNLDAAQLEAALDVASLAKVAAALRGAAAGIQSLRPCAASTGRLRDLCMAEEIGVITYFSLAKGFLSGKYRSEADLGKSPRGGGVAAYLERARLSHPRRARRRRRRAIRPSRPRSRSPG